MFDSLSTSDASARQQQMIRTSGSSNRRKRRRGNRVWTWFMASASTSSVAFLLFSQSFLFLGLDTGSGVCATVLSSGEGTLHNDEAIDLDPSADHHGGRQFTADSTIPQHPATNIHVDSIGADNDLKARITSQLLTDDTDSDVDVDAAISSKDEEDLLSQQGNNVLENHPDSTMLPPQASGEETEKLIQKDPQMEHHVQELVTTSGHEVLDDQDTRSLSDDSSEEAQPSHLDSEHHNVPLHYETVHTQGDNEMADEMTLDEGGSSVLDTESAGNDGIEESQQNPEHEVVSEHSVADPIEGEHDENESMKTVDLPDENAAEQVPTPNVDVASSESEDHAVKEDNYVAEEKNESAAGSSETGPGLGSGNDTAPQHHVDSSISGFASETIMVQGIAAERAPEGSLASFFEKLNQKQQHDKKSTPSSFEALSAQQQEISDLNDSVPTQGRATDELRMPELSAEDYVGLPWGIQPKSFKRRLPDLELLYLVFQDRMTADSNFYKFPRPEARFPLSVGQEQDIPDIELEDDEMRQLLLEHEEHIASLLKVSDEAASRLSNQKETRKEDQRLVQEEKNQSNEEADLIYDDLVEGLDDIDKFFQGVDPPEELDVGAASGSSMQELIMGKGRQILVKRVFMGYNLLRKLVSNAKEKLLQITQKNANSDKSLSDEENDDDRIHFLKDVDFKNKLLSFWRLAERTIKSIASFVDDLVDGDEASSDDMPLEQNLDAIRKMSGLKQPPE